MERGFGQTVARTISLPAAVLFLAGAVVTWIAFDTEPPGDDLRSLVGALGFLVMTAAGVLQSKQTLDHLKAPEGPS